jgi:hypothetical protein
MGQKKLNFYFSCVLKIHQPITKMSFRDELNDEVKCVRNNIKIKAVNYFTDRLKTAMLNTAKKGETKGAIALRINFMEDEDEDEEYDEEYVVLRRLNDILLIEEAKRTTEDFEGSKIYEWLLKQIHKSGVFDDIHICLNIDTYEMEYFWEVDEE